MRCVDRRHACRCSLYKIEVSQNPLFYEALLFEDLLYFHLAFRNKMRSATNMKRAENPKIYKLIWPSLIDHKATLKHALLY